MHSHILSIVTFVGQNYQLIGVNDRTGSVSGSLKFSIASMGEIVEAASKSNILGF